MLTDAHILKYQELYRHHYGREVSREEAREQGTMLLRLMQVIYRPMTELEFVDTVVLRGQSGHLPSNSNQHGCK